MRFFFHLASPTESYIHAYVTLDAHAAINRAASRSKASAERKNELAWNDVLVLQASHLNDGRARHMLRVEICC